MTDSFFRDEPEPSGPATVTGMSAEPEHRSEVESNSLPTEDDRLAAVMSYIPFLCFIPLVNLNWKDNKQARFHARQGIILFLIELTAVLFLIDDLAKFVFRAVLITAAAFAAAGIYFALQGKSYRLPIISDLADRVKM